MRLCFICSIVKWAVNPRRWVNYFVEKGYDVHVIGHGEVDIPGAKMHHLTTISKVNFITGPIQTRRIIRKIKPDIVHALGVTPFGFYGALSGFHPFIVSAWGSDIAEIPDRSPILGWIVRHTLKKADLICVQDPLSGKRVQELGGEKDKIKVHRWGVDLTKFSPDRKSEKWRKKLQKVNGPVVIILCNIEKDFTELFLKAMELKEFSNVNFIIIRNEELKKKLDWRENFQFAHRIPHKEIQFYIANSDLFIDPYHPKKIDEIGHTYGMALLEAMACGTATLAAERPTITMLKGQDKWEQV